MDSTSATRTPAPILEGFAIWSSASDSTPLAGRSITLEWGPRQQLRSMHGCARAAWWSQPATAPRAPLPPPSIVPAWPRVSPPGPRPTSLIGRALPAPPGTSAATMPACCSIPRRKKLSGWASPARTSRWPRCSKVRAIAWLPWPWRLTNCFVRMRRSFLRPSTRAAWQQDAAAFSGWLAAFDEICRSGNLLSPGRLPYELISLLETDSTERPPLLLAGFDRILPVQRSLFDAWGEWHEAAQGRACRRNPFPCRRRRPGRTRRLRNLVRPPTRRQPQRSSAGRRPGRQRAPRRDRARLPPAHRHGRGPNL